VRETIKNKKVIERLLYSSPDTGKMAVHESDIPVLQESEKKPYIQ
jgi:hypothetical protein